ncbi:hypothetical protein A4X13_0g8661, partial [Tilletia indica]
MQDLRHNRNGTDGASRRQGGPSIYRGRQAGAGRGGGTALIR